MRTHNGTIATNLIENSQCEFIVFCAQNKSHIYMKSIGNEISRRNVRTVFLFSRCKYEIYTLHMTNQNLSHRHFCLFSHSFINGIEKLHNSYAIRVRTRAPMGSHRLTPFDFGINHSIHRENRGRREYAR